MRFPSSSPAFSAGPSLSTFTTSTPSVSRRLPPPPSVRPSTGRSSMSSRFITRRRGESSEASTVLIFTSRVRPSAYTLSVTSSPAFALRSSRTSRRVIMPSMSASPASAAERRRLTPFTDWMRLPSSSPAFSAGPPGVIAVMRRPSVSRLPPHPVLTPIIGRSSSSSVE